MRLDVHLIGVGALARAGYALPKAFNRIMGTTIYHSSLTHDAMYNIYFVDSKFFIKSPIGVLAQW